MGYEKNVVICSKKRLHEAQEKANMLFKKSKATDENLKEYFVEAYGYLDGDDAVPALLAYIQENICQ